MAKEKKGAETPPAHKFHSICVFGGSSLGKDDRFTMATHELGNVLADRKINLVFSGGIHGLRGCIATTMLVRGSHVLSVCLQDVNGKKASGHTLGMEVQVPNMYERFGNMLCNADAFIALPGGVETLEGILCVTLEAKLNFGMKPIGLLNINGFYDNLLSFLDHAVEQKFISPWIRRLIVSATNADQLVDLLQTCAFSPDLLLTQVYVQIPDDDEKREVDTNLRL